MNPIKMFISYRSLDSDKVDTLVARLRSLKNADGAPRFDIWQDKHNIPDGHDWWEAIVDAIIKCQIFIFMVSRESVKNANCRAELSYAHKRNRPILPLVLEDEFFHDPKRNKNDLDYWNDVPKELNDLRLQLLFYEGGGWLPRIERAIAEFEREPQRWRDIPAAKPLDPRNASDATNNTATLYADACDYAWRLELTTAERLFRKLVRLNDPMFAEHAYQWVLILLDYQMLMTLDARESTRYQIPVFWKKYTQQFPQLFTALFDPKGFEERFANDSSTLTKYGITAEQYLERARASFDEEDFDSAIVSCTTAIELKSGYAEAYSLRGYSYTLKRAYDAAITDYTQAIVLNPDDGDAYHRRGFVYGIKGDYDSAITDYSEAIRLKPDYVMPYKNRGFTYFLRKEYESAIADYEAALKIIPDDEGVKESLEQALKAQDAAKLTDNSTPISVTPSPATSKMTAEEYFNRGKERHIKHDYDGAIADFTEAIHLKPDYVFVYVRRGLIYYHNKKDYSRAIADYESALHIDPNDAKAKLALELARRRLKNNGGK